MSMKNFFGSVKGGFKLGKSKPKVQGRFLRMKSFKTKQKIKKNVNFAKKFFKKDVRTQKRWVRRKWNMIKRNRAEKSLESGQSTKKRSNDATKKKKGGFNPFKFIMTIFAGWLINQLPAIMNSVKKFIDMAKPVFETLKKWATGIVDFFTWIGDGIKNLWNSITGTTDSVDSEKKALETENKKLKDSFKKQKKGFDDLEKKAKGEEKNLKKDMDDVNKEVNKELDSKGIETTSATGEEILPNSNPTPKLQRDSVINRKPYTGTNERRKEFQRKITGIENREKYGGTGGPVTTVINGVEKTLHPGTPEYAKFFGVKPKNGNVNLKSDSSNKNKVIEVPVIQPAPKMTRDPVTSGSTPNIGDKDSVNSKDLMLHGIEK